MVFELCIMQFRFFWYFLTSFAVKFPASDVKQPKQQKPNTLSHRNMLDLECGPVPNVMAALPNIGGALCSTP